MNKHILIVGSGSVGKRHARNLSALGCRISCVDPRDDRRQELNKETPVVACFDELETALVTRCDYDGVVIGSPPCAHLNQCLKALENNIPVLLEKPVSSDLESSRRLRTVVRTTNVPLLLGYTWRWWPPLLRVRELLANNTIGNLRHVQFHISAHLADWHPWEPYQDFFMSSRSLGGGALLDESHWIDLAVWLFGMPNTLISRVEKLSDLEIDTDDNVDMFLAYPGNLRVSLHLDIFGRPHEKFIRFIGERGTILWTADPNRITIGRGASGWQEVESFSCERNDMFIAVAKEFVAVIDGQRDLSCNIDDGVHVLEIVAAARASSKCGKEIRLEKGSI
jgi:predicted dehydrogenase